MARDVADSKFLFQRAGSANWYVRFVVPGENGRRKVIEKSLGTPDKDAALLAASADIKAHRTLMFERRQARVGRIVHGPWASEYTPGLHTLDDGRTLIATERDLTFSDGTRRPNGGPMIYLTGAPLDAAQTFKALDDAWDNGAEGPVTTDRPVLVAAKASPDDALLETYITHAGLNPVRTKEARAIWATFKRVVDKPLAECTRDDGRKVVAALGDVKSATARRTLVPLVALCNLAINEGKLTFNPFAGVVADKGDSERGVPFTDDDVRAMRANLGKLDKADQLLVRLLACTGMRRGEALAIDREHVENGVRYVMVGEKPKPGGRKTLQSVRRVPLPADLLKHLPKKITGPLFTGRPDGATHRLGDWLRNDCGITDPLKAPMHSFRHRMQDRLRAAGCPQDIREELLGHERKTVAAGYGKGSPVPVLRKWLDKANAF